MPDLDPVALVWAMTGFIRSVQRLLRELRLQRERKRRKMVRQGHDKRRDRRITPVPGEGHVRR